MTKIANITTNALADIATYCAFPGVSTVIGLWDQFQEGKIAVARDILFKEIEAGDFSGIPQDDRLSIIHRYLQASINGTAKLNLRLLAKLIKGITQNNENLLPGMYASEFNRYSNILADLSYEELQILATIYKFKIQEENQIQTGFQTSVSSQQADPSDPYDKARRWLSGVQVVGKQGRKIMSPGEFNAITASLIRTGLVYSFTSGAIGGGGFPNFLLSPLFFKMISLFEFQSVLDALDEENG